MLVEIQKLLVVLFVVCWYDYHSLKQDKNTSMEQHAHTHMYACLHTLHTHITYTHKHISHTMVYSFMLLTSLLGNLAALTLWSIVRTYMLKLSAW